MITPGAETFGRGRVHANKDRFERGLLALLGAAVKKAN